MNTQTKERNRRSTPPPASPLPASQARMERKRRQLEAMTPEERQQYEERRKAYQREWYLKHQEEHKARSAARREEKREPKKPSPTKAPPQAIPVRPPVDPTTCSLAEWCYEWFEVYKRSEIGESTAKIYLDTHRRLMLSPLMRKPLVEIGQRDIKLIFNDLQNARHHGNRPYSKSTLSKAHTMLVQALEVAYEEGYIAENPCLRIKTPKAPTKKVYPLSHAEEERLLLACQSDPLGHVYEFLLLTGLRRDELANLRWCDYSATNHEIFVRKSKTKAGIRILPLLSRAEEIVNAQPQINEYIFNNTRGQPLTPTTLRRAYDRLRKRAMVPNLTNHVCRHTFVTRLCEKRAPVKAISKIIGHANSKYVLDIYADMEDSELRKAIYLLEPAG